MLKNTIILLFVTSFFLSLNLSANAEPTNNPYFRGSSEEREKASKIQAPFIKNEGQIESQDVKYYIKTFNGTVYINDKSELIYGIASPKYYLGPDDVLLLNGTPSQLIVQNLTEKPVCYTNNEIQGLEAANTYVNYIIDSEENWKNNIPTYNLIGLGELWNGVDYYLKATNRNIEKVFVISPEGNVDSIQFSFDGIESIDLLENGQLQVNTFDKNILFTAPFAYQEINRTKEYIDVSYKIIDEFTYGFKVGQYNKSLPLVIDPLLASTFIGGNSEDVANGIVRDVAGNVFIAGYSSSSTYPTTAGAYQGSYTAGYDIVVSKFNSDVTSILASTYIGSQYRSELGYGIAIDGSGNVFIVGATGTSASSSTFPSSSGSYDTTFNGSWDVFVARLNNDLTTPGYAFTFLGGNGADYGFSIAIDGNNNVIVCGQAGNATFPAVGGAYTTFGGGTSPDGFVARFNNTLSGAGFVSSYLGGNGSDICYGITVDNANNVIVTGNTLSSNFPIIAGAADPTANGSSEVFVTKLNNTISSTLYSTLLGGNGWDVGVGIATDSAGNVYVTGSTNSSNLPVIPANNSTFNGGPSDAFVTKLNPSLSSFLASRFLGGSGTDIGENITIGPFASQVFINGYTNSTNFPVIPTSPAPYQSSLAGSSDVFIVRLSNGLSLIASTYIGGSLAELGTGPDNRGGIMVDPSANVYVTGGTASQNYPTANAFYGTYAGGAFDIFLSKLTPDLRGGDVITTTTLDSPVLIYPPNPSNNEPIPVVLQWNPPANAIAPVLYTVYLSTSSYPETVIYTGNDTSFTLSGLNYEITYYWYIVAADAAQRTSWTNIFSFRTQVNPLFITGSSGNVVLGQDAFTKPLGSCFIASAVYKNPMHPDVISLRNLRDNYLLNNPIGQNIVEQYYQKGPNISRYLNQHPKTNSFLRIALLPLIITMKYPIMMSLILITILLIALFISRRIYLKKINYSPAIRV